MNQQRSVEFLDIVCACMCVCLESRKGRHVARVIRINVSALSVINAVQAEIPVVNATPLLGNASHFSSVVRQLEKSKQLDES